MCARRAPMSAQRRAPTIFQPSGMGLNVRRVGRKLTVHLQRDRLHVGDDLRHNFGTIYLVCLPPLAHNLVLSLTTRSIQREPDEQIIDGVHSHLVPLQLAGRLQVCLYHGVPEPVLLSPEKQL